MNRPLVVVVSKRSMYERVIQEQRDPKAISLLQRRDISVARWRKAHLVHQLTLRRVLSGLRALGAKITVLRSPAVVFDASDASLVVTVGGDGTLLAASHHVGSIPILGVNSSPEHSVGFFCPAHLGNLLPMLERALDGTLPSVSLSRMQVSVNNRILSRRVLNEALFCHAIPAATSRYIVSFGGKSEEQRSSGVWVSTAAGSTGAARSAGGRLLPFASRKLQLVVREPYLELRRDTRPVPLTLDRLVFEPPESLTLLSKMEDARLYLDGPFRQMPVGLGDRVVCSVSSEPLHVFGLGRRRLESPASAPARQRPASARKKARRKAV
ncbi:MAG TPA: NAD(+)/NADH kinase [Polyangiaceae bacterium]|nr:NAD(+)/NADH kinase [Polyangiaceae bacterium]